MWELKQKPPIPQQSVGTEAALPTRKLTWFAFICFNGTEGTKQCVIRRCAGLVGCTPPQSFSYRKDTVHPVLKLQSCTANDPFTNDIGFCLWFGLLLLALSHRAFLHSNGDMKRIRRQLCRRTRTHRQVLIWKPFRTRVIQLLKPYRFIQLSHALVSYLNPLLVAAALDNPVDVDAGYVDVPFSKSSNIHHLLHLHTHRETQKKWAFSCQNFVRPLTLKLSW